MKPVDINIHSIAWTRLHYIRKILSVTGPIALLLICIERLSLGFISWQTIITQGATFGLIFVELLLLITSLWIDDSFGCSCYYTVLVRPRPPMRISRIDYPLRFSPEAQRGFGLLLTILTVLYVSWSSPWVRLLIVAETAVAMLLVGRGDHEHCSRCIEFFLVCKWRVAEQPKVMEFEVASLVSVEGAPKDLTPFLVHLPSDLVGVLECGICMEPLTSELVSVKLACDHAYHEECAFRWFSTKDTCPTCRAQVDLHLLGESISIHE